MRYILIFSLEEHNSKYRPTYLNFREHLRSSMNRNPTAKLNTHREAAMTSEFGGSIDVPPFEIIPDMTELPSFLGKTLKIDNVLESQGQTPSGIIPSYLSHPINPILFISVSCQFCILRWFTVVNFMVIK